MYYDPTVQGAGQAPRPLTRGSSWSPGAVFAITFAVTVALVLALGVASHESQYAVQHHVADIAATSSTPYGTAVHSKPRGWLSSAATSAAARLQPLQDSITDALMQMLMGDKMKLVAPENALPGRDEAMQIINEHFILKTPIEGPFPEGLETIVFGTGCFWGTEKMFWKIPGVYSTAVGYAAGYTKNPTYEEVCSGMTGHNEVVLVVYDPKKIAFADLLRNFWESHNPTQGMGQGNDMGTQYRSGIYPTTDAQRKLAEASLNAYQKAISAKGYGPITTEIVDNVDFYYAENYHQQYLAKPMSRPYCSAQPSGISVPAFAEWGLSDMKEYAPKLPDSYWDKYGPKPGCTIAGPNTQNVL